ncbi:MAG: molecular chaperone DnaJ [Archangium gephyra]|uniref:Molecular chaperone DnaJ n=1 Tax=Archangium gephyra TaxID=48 RepID=A0A2W5VK13_9BACT|nr:MAG: molecular chaperone DnaJ [Archangium gephyra]
MFPPRREVVRQKSGTLLETPLPLLLHALLVEERSAVLELKLRNLEKRIFFEAGVPVGCESNLQHETLGHSLVARGKLTAAQHHAALAEAAAKGRALQGVLVERQLISGFELFKHLQAMLGRTVLDAFRWSDATWKLLPPEELEAPIRINSMQLIFVGCMQLPLAALTEQLSLPDDEVLAFLPDAPEPHEELKLSARDTRLLQALKKRLTLGELAALNGFSPEEVHRKLYALRVLEFIDSARAVDAVPVRSRPPPAPQPTPLPVKLPVEAGGLPFADDDEATQNLLASEFLSFRGKDAFELLGVDVDAQGAALQKAFLSKSAALSPLRFKNPETRAKADALHVAYARAFGALSDPEVWQQHRARRAARAAGSPDAARKKAAAEAYRIRTDLLDAQSQFEEGRRRLAAGNARSAAEHFQYALDIEPRGRFSAWLAFAKYQLEPQREAERALVAMVEACRQEPDCEEAWAWAGDIAMSLSRHAEAEDAYRQAWKLAPSNKRYVEGAKAAAALRQKK